MWTPSKTILLILIVLMSLLGAISLSFIDWNLVDIGLSNAIKEFRLTFVFWGLGIYFLFPYVRKIKESRSS